MGEERGPRDDGAVRSSSLSISFLYSLSLRVCLSLPYSLSLSLTFALCPRSPPPPLTVFTLIAKVGGAWEEGRRRGREEVEKR